MTTMILTTSFGTEVRIRDPIVTEHAWGEQVEGFAQVGGQLSEDWICTRLDTALNVRWYPDDEED